MSELVKRLRAQALEIAEENHFGWGNTMQEAADRIEELEREKVRLEAREAADDEYRASLIKHIEQRDARIEELERQKLALVRELSTKFCVTNEGASVRRAAETERIEELERALRKCITTLPLGDVRLEEARAVLEKES